MRTIDHIVIHCSATREDRSLTVTELEENHRCRGFRGIGYHYYIRKDGTVINTRALALRLLVHQLLKRFRNNVRICGHRDLSPDLNGDGVIEPEEWIKECPCFEVSREL